MRSNKTLRTACTGASALFLCAACMVSPVRPGAPAEAPIQPPKSAPSPADAPTPQPPPPPRLPTAQDKQRAEQLATEAINPLQAGDVASGRGLLEQALALDPNNELARLMMRQITADPVTELGATHYSYTIQRDDTLAKLAQRFLNDRHLFYILARYNDIAQPNRIQFGQMIRIPGKAPQKTDGPAVPATARPAPAPPAPMAPAPAPVAAPADDAIARRVAEGGEQERKGDLEAAMTTYGDVLRQEPAHAEASQRATAVRRRLVDRHYGEGTAAFARQDLDKAITAWDRVLQLDPEHQNAKLKRQQALDLKERLKRFDNKK